MVKHKRYVVAGGGISGLTAAYELLRGLSDAPESTEIILLDSNAKPGGVLQTLVEDKFVIETSADMFTVDPDAAILLCRQLGIEDELLTAKPAANRAFVATETGMEPIPRGFSLMYPGDIQAVLDSKILSEAGKARFLEEEFVPIGDHENDESLEQFAVRRFGREVFERLIQPLASGIYTADPKTLSMHATMERFRKLELQLGSLIGAARKDFENSNPSETSGARYGLFRAPQAGIGRLVECLVQKLESARHVVDAGSQCNVDIRCNIDVQSIENIATDSSSRFRVHVHQQGGSPTWTDCDGVILATPSSTSASLLSEFGSPVIGTLRRQLNSIKAASSAIVVMAVEKSQLSLSDFAGYGIIIPSSLKRQAIAVSFASNKFTGRAPENHQLIRVFIGGALQGELVELDDDQLIGIATNELDRLIGFSGPPRFSKVIRWRNCMPQYTLGHLDRVDEIESLTEQIDGLELAGKSYRGVGIPACIASGKAAAIRLIETSSPFAPRK